MKLLFDQNKKNSRHLPRYQALIGLKARGARDIDIWEFPGTTITVL
jgi:hypothetical protein